MKPFENIPDTLGWIRLFLSPFLAGLLIGGALVIFADHMVFKLLGVLLFIGGIFLGAFVANSAGQAGGTQETLSQLERTSDWELLTEDMRKKEEDEKNN